MTLTDDEFVSAWKASGGSPGEMAAALGLPLRSVYRRRSAMADRGIVLTTSTRGTNKSLTPWTRECPAKPARLEVGLSDGVIVVFSDAHYWPGEPSVSHRALLSVIRALKPYAVIANGDMLDGATISRHPRNGWEQRPGLAKEREACQERLGEVEDAAGVDAQLLWTIGNHDARFERYLSANAPEMEGLPGATLPEHFPRWQFCMSVMVNPGTHHPVMVKHRHHNGVHAAYNNTLKGGISVVTGHLHRLVVTTWGDYRGRRYGVDTGTLADPEGPQFSYMEDNPSPHGQGFAVLTFRGGELLHPELVEVRGDAAFFRGEKVA